MALNLNERTLSQAWSLLSMLLTITVAAAFGCSSPISRKVIFIGVRADCEDVNRCLEGNRCKLHLLADSSPNAALRLAVIGTLRTGQLCRSLGHSIIPAIITGSASNPNFSKLPALRDALGFGLYNVCGPRLDCRWDHSSPRLSLTHFLHRLLNSFGSSRHSLAASTFAGLSSLGELSMLITDNRIVSGLWTGDHRSEADS